MLFRSSTAGVDIDRDGKTVWIIDRCGANSCYDATTGKMSDADPILHFDENGRLLGFRVPAQGLQAVRDDMAAVSTRRMTMSRPNDADVRFDANGFSLAGTISRPEGRPEPLPAVILVSGPGLTDRDETIGGIPVFGQLAHALADAGFAVLRFDRRGVGQSGGRTESATLDDYAEDVRAAVRMMRDRKDIDRRRIALVGLGQGGALAMIAASKEKQRIGALVLLGALGTSGADLNLYQLRHGLERSNRSAQERESTMALQQAIQQAVVTGKGWDAITVDEAVRRQADTPYFQSFLTYDPARVMNNVEQPILILHGALDRQVPPDHADRLEALAKQRKKAPGVESVKVPGVNHLLVPARTGEVDEYARLGEGDATVSPEVTRAVEAWLKKALRQGR